MRIGTEIKYKLEERGMTIVGFARQLNFSRTNVYKIFEKESIDCMLLLRISRVLNYDFFQLYSKEFKGKANKSSHYKLR